MLKNKKQQKKETIQQKKEFKSTKEKNDYFLRDSVSRGKKRERSYKVL